MERFVEALVRRLPTGRAEFIADWVEQFAPQATFTALAVEHDGQLVAGLPLVERRVARLIKAGSLPSNSSCWAGGLLVDPTSNVADALSTLLSEVRRLPWSMLWFDMAPLESAGWRQFLAAMDELKFSYEAHERFQIGTIQIVEQLDRNWDAYEAAWSGNHRRHLRKALRRAESEGGVELQLVQPRTAGELESLLREGFEVEHRSWKGTAGSSVLSDAVMWQFYLRQATELARCGELELAFLRYEAAHDCLRIWLDIARRVLHSQSWLRQRILAIQPRPIVAIFVVEGNVRTQADRPSIFSVRSPKPRPSGRRERIRFHD